jgi:SAM-dependent methyltransferase
MNGYEINYAPQSQAEAEWLIDTAKSGKKFWDAGQQMASIIQGMYPSDWALGTIVDYGCGIGRVLRWAPGMTRIGFDTSLEMLAIGKRIAGQTQTGTDIQWRLTDGKSIPLPAGTVTMVYSFLTLQHMDAPDVVDVLKDTFRVLRKGGRCYHLFSDFGTPWGSEAVLQRGPAIWKGQRAGSGAPGHATIAYTPEIVRTIAEEAGFKPSKTEIVPSKGDGRDNYLALKAEK